MSGKFHVLLMYLSELLKATTQQSSSLHTPRSRCFLLLESLFCSSRRDHGLNFSDAQQPIVVPFPELGCIKKISMNKSRYRSQLQSIHCYRIMATSLSNKRLDIIALNIGPLLNKDTVSTNPYAFLFYDVIIASKIFFTIEEHLLS